MTVVVNAVNDNGSNASASIPTPMTMTTIYNNRRKTGRWYLVAIALTTAWFLALQNVKHILGSNPYYDYNVATTPTTTAIMARNNTACSDSHNNNDTSLSSSTMSLLLADHCRKTLDALEVTFDEKRAKRREYLYEKIQVLHQKIGNKSTFDPYEAEAVCISEERFGGKPLSKKQPSNDSLRYKAFGDGPKFVCGVDYMIQQQRQQRNDKETSPCLVYSVGSYNDVTFERAVKTVLPNCEIHTFDPTLKKNRFVGSKYATFHPWGFGVDGEKITSAGAGGGKTFATKSFETIRTKLGHDHRPIDIFKMDCEGCEYTVLVPMFNAIANGTLQVHQMQIELHSHDNSGEKKNANAGDARDSATATSSLQQLFEAADRANMRIFHKERNGWGCQGYKCVEYAFVSQSFLRRANAHVLCRGDSDSELSRS